jgi:pimeloyl-ACP methyl ester carboxylesterase
MPYVDNDGVKIYYETEGKGPPLMLHSGLSGTLENYRDFGYTEPLKNNTV